MRIRRKYKVCCLPRSDTAAAVPLEERVRWLWEKLRRWLERLGPFGRTMQVAITLHDGELRSLATDPVLALAVDLDLAASLVLFADGAVRWFVGQRHALLPADEASLVAQWASSPVSLFEVTDVSLGTGFSLRDMRTGDTVAVHEDSGSRHVVAGDVVLTHPVFDGRRHRIVGGMIGLPARRGDVVIEALDAEVGSLRLARIMTTARGGRTAC